MAKNAGKMTYGGKMMTGAKAVRSNENTEFETEGGKVFFPFEFEFGSGTNAETETVGFNPIARNLGDLVSAKQTGLARFLAGSKGLDENEIADNLFGCDFSELSKTAAGLLIEYLEDRAVNVKARLRLAG